MSITKEITKIIEYQNSTLLLKDKENKTTINALIQQAIDDYENGNYDFTSFKEVNKKQIGKIRRTKSYENFSCEKTLCIF